MMKKFVCVYCGARDPGTHKEFCIMHPDYIKLQQEVTAIMLDQHEPGAKLDHGKPELDLLQDFGLALEAVGKVATFGAKKYSRGGWLHVPDGARRYTAAMLRHFFKEEYEMYDEEDQRHAAQVAWNALARLELMLRQERQCD